MADNNLFKAFGFELSRVKKSNTANDKATSIVPKVDEDGAGYVTASGSYFGQYVDMEGTGAKDNQELIKKYRNMAEHPECDAAIEDIINETIVSSELESSVSINLDKVNAPDKIKKTITEEFNGVVSMLNFEEYGHDIFRSWYVDGRIYHHLVVDESNLKGGILECRPIDATKVRKVKEVQYKKDVKTGAKVVDKTNDFYVYQERAGANNGIKLSPDSVSYVTSGLLDTSKKRVLSYLQKAMKPVNQLRMMEDSLVIYRMARAPERRIFYIDVGNMPKGKAEQHLKDIMARYRNKIVYDANTGEIKDDRKHMSMLEDFWLPRREGGRGTEISTLPGGENLGTTEINRDEVKFQKFIDRLRKKFAHLFLGVLKKQLLLKGICTEQDWEDWKSEIQVDFSRDNHFVEMKDAELLRERLQTMDQISAYVGEYFSREWVMKNVMMFNDEDITNMAKEVENENKDSDDDTDEINPKDEQ